jgi:hypothetical protein
VNPDHLVGKGAGRTDYAAPQRRSAFDNREAEVKPANDEFMAKAVSLLHDVLKRS